LRKSSSRTIAVLLSAGSLFACAEFPLLKKEGEPPAPPAPVAKPPAERPAPIPLSQLMKKPGGFYNDDAPDGPPPVDLDKVADATPKPEPMNSRANEPYTVYGREYVPYRATIEYRRQGTISWYGRKFHGQRTWSGDVYDMYGMTGAHPTLPIPSYVRVTNLENRRTVVVRVNDRGPFLSGRVMDVSYAAAYRLGFHQSGTATVEVEALLPAEPQQQVATAPSSTLPAKPKPAARKPPAVAAVKPEPAKPDPAETEAQFALSADAPGIFLQLGAFGAPANAESFRSKVQPQLAEEKLAAQIVEREKLYRVQVGPFRTRLEAAQTAEKLREPLGIRPLVVVR
jgi:rare lipoprotein A